MAATDERRGLFFLSGPGLSPFVDDVFERVDSAVLDEDLVMQMRTGAIARIPDGADDLAPLYPLPLPYLVLLIVPVKRFEPEAVGDDDDPPIASHST